MRAGEVLWYLLLISLLLFSFFLVGCRVYEEGRECFFFVLLVFSSEINAGDFFLTHRTGMVFLFPFFFLDS